MPNSLSSLCELLPFRYCTARDTDRLGGIDKSRCTWSRVYRSGMNDYLVRTSRLTHQFATPLSNISAQHRIPVLRHPDHVILAVPNGLAAALVPFHTASVRVNAAIPYRLKAWGLLIPYRGL